MATKKQRQAAANEKAKARLTLVIVWDDDMRAPTPDDIEEIIDKARETGHVVKATYESLKTFTEELV